MQMMPPGYVPAGMPPFQPVPMPTGQPMAYPPGGMPGIPYPQQLTQQNIVPQVTGTFQPIPSAGSPVVMSKETLQLSFSTECTIHVRMVRGTRCDQQWSCRARELKC